MLKMIQVHCLASTGIPIFSCRSREDVSALPFTTVGSLNGVHLFCKSQGAQIKSTQFEDGFIIWREFIDRYMIIVVAKFIPEIVLEELAEICFGSLVLCVGYEGLIQCTSVERLKKEIKTGYQIIEFLLNDLKGILPTFSEMMPYSKTFQMQEFICDFVEQCDLPFCCIMKDNKTVGASEGWLNLDVIDRNLLTSCYIVSGITPLDIPVFLPKKSPNIAFRLVAVHLSDGFSMCVLCGVQPQTKDIEYLAKQLWLKSPHSLQSYEPYVALLDPTVEMILLTNRLHHKYMLLSLNCKNQTLRMKLIDFYQTHIVRIKQSCNNTDSDPSEFYKISNDVNVYSILQDDNTICIQFKKENTKQTNRNITQRILNSITADKTLSW